MGEEELQQLIRGCIKRDRMSQKKLYKAFYGFSMAICLRYAGDRDEAAEVMNQGFFKVFTNIDRYDATRPFKAWLGRIMMNASIDYYRSNLKMAYTDDLEKAEHISNGDMADRKLHYEDLLQLIQKLPNAYRTVFNLFAIDGLSHEEIAEKLGISTGTSKSNLHKARQKLKQMIEDAESSVNNRRFDAGSMGYTPIVAISGIDVGGIFLNNIRR